MSLISNVESFGCIMLEQALKHIEKGFYIDIGISGQNSTGVAFCKRGWSGIEIESLSQRLKEKRFEDINLETVSNAESDRKFAKNLTEICDDRHFSIVHFLKIDMDGSKKELLEGLDLSRIRPWIILIKSVCNWSIESHEEWEDLLLKSNYDFVCFDGLNRIYMAKEHQELGQYFKLSQDFEGFLKNQLNQFCSEMSAKQNKIDLLKNNFDMAKTQINVLQKELMLSKEKIDELNYSSHHYWTATQQLNQTLDNIYNSTPWRIASLVDKYRLFFTFLLNAVTSQSTLLFLLKRMIRLLFKCLIIFTPKDQRLRKHSSLGSVKRFALSRGLLPFALPTPRPSITLHARANLTPRANEILCELETGLLGNNLRNN